MKRLIQSALRKAGYELRRIPNDDPSLYLPGNYYNVGAGLFQHPAWTNVDYYSEWYKGNDIHINLDLLSLQPFPIASNSANAVYSSHTVEHITNDAAQNMFNESYRILKPGGFLRITTPNIDLYYKALQNNDKAFWQWEIDTYSTPREVERVRFCRPMNSVSLKQVFLYAFASQLCELISDPRCLTISDSEFDDIFNLPYEDALNHIISKCKLEVQKDYPGHHINWWNGKKLIAMLHEAGFEDAYLSAYGQSLCPVLRNTSLFDSTHPQLSLYVEARK